MGWTPVSFFLCSVGWRRMDSAASNLRNAAQRFGWWCGRARDPHFAVRVLRCWADSALILHWMLRFWGKFWMLLVQLHLLFLCMKVRVFWQRLLQANWEVGTVRTAASVFGRFDPFSKTEFVVNCLTGAETRDWMASCPALRKAINTNDLSMSGLGAVVANTFGVWPLVVSHIKETGRQDDGDNFVVKFSILAILFASFECTHYCLAV